MSKKLARPLSDAAPPLRVALRELDDLATNMMWQQTGSLTLPELRALFYAYGKRMAEASAKLRRRMDTLLGMIPEQVNARRADAADAFMSFVATEVAQNEVDPVTVGDVERWLEDNYRKGTRDPATIRAALKRIQRLKRNPRGRPRKASPP